MKPRPKQAFFTAHRLDRFMAVELERRVDYAMLDGANIAYYPRIFDLAHRFFEEAWAPMCGTSYPEMINVRKIGFPVVHVETDFIAPLKYGDVIHATLSIGNIGTSSCTWNYVLRNQDQVVLWRSSQVTVCVNMDTLASQPIPEDLRAGLLAHQEEGVQ
tara:strand:+ start:2545 stop:3021 length:477 start_codon:yes stop_codon:yes gene_type:complete